jgi:6-pyruvoyltetrahydropterin/6-carboxytetrahydropterin synthase
MYVSTKTYGHEIGLSACFRQHRAESHCNLLHGYALAVKFEFGATELDVRNWVVDFGGLKGLRTMLEDTFDHTLLVAEDDPMREELERLGLRPAGNAGTYGLERLGLARVVVVPATGCESFARMIYEVTEQWLLDAGFAPRCQLLSVEVREHGANSAIYTKGRQ